MPERRANNLDRAIRNAKSILNASPPEKSSYGRMPAVIGHFNIQGSLVLPLFKYVTIQYCKCALLSVSFASNTFASCSISGNASSMSRCLNTIFTQGSCNSSVVIGKRTWAFKVCSSLNACISARFQRRNLGLESSFLMNKQFFFFQKRLN